MATAGYSAKDLYDTLGVLGTKVTALRSLLDTTAQGKVDDVSSHSAYGIPNAGFDEVSAAIDTIIRLTDLVTKTIS